MLFVVTTENLKNLKYHTSQKKHKFFQLFAVSVKMKMKKISKIEESIEILKILGFINSTEEFQKI